MSSLSTAIRIPSGAQYIILILLIYSLGLAEVFLIHGSTADLKAGTGDWQLLILEIGLIGLLGVFMVIFLWILARKVARRPRKPRS